MKKLICMLAILILTVCALAGCAPKKAIPFTSDNEIATYAKVDVNKTQLTVARLGNNANVEKLAAAFEKKNPDVQVIVYDLTGGDIYHRPVIDWITHGLVTDVLFANQNTFSGDEVVVEYFEDLSTSPVIASFEAEALSRVAVNGFVYFLPSPSEINCILYNKTMFEQYGWSVPKTFDEFVALCVQIREDTNGAIQPWNPNAKYDSVFSIAIEAFVYEELFGGIENRVWYKEFCNGQNTFAGHMEPLYAALQALIDNGILLEEHFNYSATTRGKDFQNGLLAMFNAPLQKMTNAEYVIDYMPYPTTRGELGYVNDAFSSMLCVSKKERTDAQRDALNRFLAFFSSVEGQQALIGDSLMVSNVKGVPLNASEAMHGIEEVIDKGHKFNQLDFSETNERTWTFKDNALAMIAQGKTGAEIIAEIDAHPYKTAEEIETIAAVKLATVTEDFTTLEFSNYIADMYREKAQADIGLINHGVAYRGNLVRLFTGDVYDTYMFPFRPRSFGNGSTLVKLSMTGQQLMDALNHPVGNLSTSNSIYAFSGLKCEVAPWNEPGKKYLSVKLADGSPLDMSKLYTVAAWEGAIDEAYITETLEAYEGSWDDLMAQKLQADGSIAPAKDGRIKLVWE